MRELRNDDTLARSVTSGYDAKRCRSPDAVIPITVFDRPGNEISVDWTDFAEHRELVALGEERARKRGHGRRFHGWVKLSVANARGQDREVRHTPVRETPTSLANPYHVDIYLPRGVPGDVRTAHLQELAECSEWQARPA